MATSNPLDSLAAGDKASSAVAASISKKETETHKKRGREKCGSTLVSEGVASDHYKPITAYEGIHRYDPDFEWGPTEEKRIVRKIDMRICSWNYGQTIFYLYFLFAELPSQLMSKKLGPDNWIPIPIILWSLVGSMRAFLSGKKSWFFIPDSILYMSYFYTGLELPGRMSVYGAVPFATNILAAFLAFGILRLRGHNGMEGWRYLFAIEGLVTGCIGIASWFYLPASPTQTATKFWNPFRREKGWFSEREEKIMVNRVLRDDPSKGDMHNRQGLSVRMLWECMKDYHMLSIYLIGLLWFIPRQPSNAYITLQLRSLGFSTFETNLLTIPAFVIIMIQMIFWTWVSERTDQRLLVALVSQVWCLPLLIALEVLPANASHWSRWVLCTLLVGSPFRHPIFMILIATCMYNLVLFVASKQYYIVLNRRRARIWDGMTREEKETYLLTTTDKGNRRLESRFAH
ncbi:major facilitator superfamily domain-containing protein [Bipolaris maydis]|nr:major facilitator superfamily domain-containing protein [Bipolaris maydis]KAJ5065648.1 major facilitator superfamily domain-containing protein [Bipolaris maydis]